MGPKLLFSSFGPIGEGIVNFDSYNSMCFG